MLIPVVGLALAFGLHLFFAADAPRQGAARRRAEPGAARLMGIDVERVDHACSFALSGVLAGVAGIMVAPLFTISSTMGTLFGIKAFAVAILGGLGSAWGVVLAGLIYGLAEALITVAARLDLHADRQLRPRHRVADGHAERPVRPRRGAQGMRLRPVLLSPPSLPAVGAFIWRANNYQLYVLALVGLTAIVGVGLNVLIGLTGQISLGHVGFYAIGAYVVGILTTKIGIGFWWRFPLAGADRRAWPARCSPCRRCA